LRIVVGEMIFKRIRYIDGRKDWKYSKKDWVRTRFYVTRKFS
jgi:hypothetical protein